MFCTHCGNKLPDNALFCTSCGARLGQGNMPENQGASRPQQTPVFPDMQGLPADWNAPGDDDEQVTQMLQSPFDFTGDTDYQKLQGNQVFPNNPNGGSGRTDAEVKSGQTARSRQDIQDFGQPQGFQSGMLQPSRNYQQVQNYQNGQSHPGAQNFQTPPRPPMDAKKKKKILIISISSGVAVMAAVMALIFFVVFKKPSININKYLKVTYDGYNTIGTVTAVIDRDAFARDYGNKIAAHIRDKSRVSQNSRYGEYVAEEFLSDCVGGSMDKYEGLSNGDEISYIWDCDVQKALAEYGVKLKYKDSSYKVEGLKETATFDPFEGVEVIYDGISPNGYASVSTRNAGEEIQNLEYELDKDSGLSNGDTVTVEVYAYYGGDLNDYCIENYGNVPSQTTKTYTVDGLDSYIMSLSDVSDASMEEMKSQARDVYYAGIAQDWGDGESLQSLDYIGSYLLKNKDSEDSWNSRNILYLVYQVQVHNSHSGGGKKYDKVNSFYWYIAYYDLLVDSSGNTTVDVLNYQLPSNDFTIDSGVEDGWGTKSWYYDGYQELDELYQAVVMANVAAYNHEDNVDANLAGTAVQGNAAAETESEMEEAGEEGIIFPKSSEEALDINEVRALTDEELRYAINELYARHGYTFKDDTLRKYYEQYDWYNPTVKPDDFSMNLFNATEKANVEMLQKERDGR